MPTGYTSQIADKDCTFRKFALSCARNFGAAIALRDDDGSIEPTPENVRFNSNFHKKKLQEIKAAQTKFKNLSPAQKKKVFEGETKKEINRLRNYIFRARKLKAKYLSYLEQVENWTPPTKDHVNMKKFMVDQIKESIEFDCGEEYYNKEIVKTTLMTFGEWNKDHVNDLKKNEVYHQEELFKDIARDDNRSQWVADLIKSLPEK